MASAPPAPAGDAASGGSKKMVPFIVALVAGLVVGGGAGAFVVGPAMASGITPAGAPAPRPKKVAHAEEEAGSEEHSEEEGAEDEEESEDEAEAEGEKESAKGGEKPVHTLDNLVLNPAESGGTRFLLLSVTFEAKNATVLEQMKARDAELRDAILVTVGSKSVEYLSDMTKRDSIKVDLTKAAAKLFKKGAVKRIYFPQFVIQ